MLANNIAEIKANCQAIHLVAATKYVDASAMEDLLDWGIFEFGENRVDAFLDKYALLKSHEEIVWHFIGSLQTNKVAKMINKIDYLHSLDNLKLARYIQKYRFKELKCFIEVNITKSNNKHGLLAEEVLPFLAEIKDFDKSKVIGLMTMTEVNESETEKLETFNKLKALKDALNEMGYRDITELSMGMSDDYLLAIKAKTTFVRLGRILFRR